MKGASYKFIVAVTGLVLFTVLCIISTFLPWISAYGSSTNLYDTYFSGTPEVFLVASGVVLAATILNILKHNKVTRILNGLIGIIAAIVIAGMSTILYLNDKGNLNSVNDYAMSSMNVSTDGMVSTGFGNYLTLGAAAGILIFSILVLAWGKSNKKKESRAAEA